MGAVDTNGTAATVVDATKTGGDAANGAAQQQVQADANGAAKPFYAEFKDADLRGWAEIKGLKTAEDATKTAFNLEKMRGVPLERVLTLPDKMDEPKALDPVYERLGWPKAPTDYKIPTVEGGEEFAKQMAPLLHGAHLNQAQVDHIANGWNAFMKGAVEKQEAEQSQKTQIEWDSLHKEWPGKVYDERVELARRAIRQFGVDEETALAMESMLGSADKPGNARLVRVWAKVGESLAESKGAGFDNQTNSSFGMTPEGAMARKAELFKDTEWVKRLNAGDASANAELNRLQIIENAGKPASSS